MESQETFKNNPVIGKGPLPFTPRRAQQVIDEVKGSTRQVFKESFQAAPAVIDKPVPPNSRLRDKPGYRAFVDAMAEVLLWDDMTITRHSTPHEVEELLDVFAVNPDLILCSGVIGTMLSWVLLQLIKSQHPNTELTLADVKQMQHVLISDEDLLKDLRQMIRA